MTMLDAQLMNLGSELFGKKWRIGVLWQLREGPMRYSELKKELPDISVKVLSEVLDELEHNKLIIRKQYTNSIPVKVTYELTEDTKSLVDVIYGYKIFLKQYASKHINDTMSSIDKTCKVAV